MPKGCPITNEQRGRIYHLHTMNVDHKSIAEQFDISVGTVSKCISKQRKLIEGMGDQKVAEIVIAGDRKNGRLTSVGTEKYEGSCLVDGKMKRRTFVAANGKAAKEQYDQWCQNLRDEKAFMDMVERKNEPEPEPEPTPEPVAETSEPVAYLIWAKRPEPRCYGLFRTMEDALFELDRLNEVAVFLGGENVFEVEEVVWR